MKLSVVAFISVCISLVASNALAAGSVSKEMQEDAEYMMRKIVEDIHQYQVRTTVTDVTRDKGIEVVGYILEFTPERQDIDSSETFSCARVSLKTHINGGESARQQIQRTDEICIGNQSGATEYMVNID